MIRRSNNDAPTWRYLDLNARGAPPDLSDGWFGALLGGLDDRRVGNIVLLARDDITDPYVAAVVISSLFPPGKYERLNLVVPDDVAAALTALGPRGTDAKVWSPKSRAERPTSNR